MAFQTQLTNLKVTLKNLFVLLTLLFLSQPIYGYQTNKKNKSYFDFPIVTHFPQKGGTKADKRRRKDVGWGKYSASLTDHTAPSKQNVINTIKKLEKKGKCLVNIYNDLNKLKSGSKRLQIINNLQIGNMLWTFVIGPNWTRGAGPYPLVISGRSGSSSNNSSLYKGGGGPLQIPSLVAKAGKDDAPFILALVNCGGRESHGVHETILHSIGQGIDFAEKEFEIDRHKIIFTGKSRGGATALTWGANPLGLDYTTAAIFTHAAPTNYYSAVHQPEGTFPHIGSVLAKELTQKSRWQVGSKHTNHIHTFMQATTGSLAKETVIAHSPVGRVSSYHGVYLALGFGTHDPSVGPSQSFDFCQRLEDKQVSCFVEYSLGGGHSNSQKVQELFKKYMVTTLKKQRFVPTLGKQWIYQGKTLPKMKKTVWTLFPKVTSVQRDNSFDIGAPKGSKIIVKAIHNDTNDFWVNESFTITRDYKRLHLPTPLPGRYRWKITVNGQRIPDEVLLRGYQGKKQTPETLVLSQERYIPEAENWSDQPLLFGHAWVMGK